VTTVAFIGLGIMGGPMAGNLVEAGFDVIGYNRSPEPVQRLVDRGGRGAGSLAEAVRDADVIVAVLDAGAGLTDEDAASEVVRTTDPNLLVEPAYEQHGGDVPSADEIDAEDER
jgi:2-hydroxy-3-oxopropionate reductase